MNNSILFKDIQYTQINAIKELLCCTYICNTFISGTIQFYKKG
jgi:hypothetical protein